MAAPPPLNPLNNAYRPAGNPPPSVQYPNASIVPVANRPSEPYGAGNAVNQGNSMLHQTGYSHVTSLGKLSYSDLMKTLPIFRDQTGTQTWESYWSKVNSE